MEFVSAIKSQAARFGSPRTGDGVAIFLPDFVQKISEEFRFVDLPKTSDDFNLTVGTVLQYGTFSGSIMSMLKIYSNGMILEGPATTDVLDGALDRIEEILLNSFNARVASTDTITRLYVSQIEVKATAAAVRGLDELAAIRERLTGMVRAYGIQVDDYTISGFSFGADPNLTPTDVKPGRFLFERRANRAFGDTIFFSDAPLRTGEHLALLAELEATLIAE